MKQQKILGILFLSMLVTGCDYTFSQNTGSSSSSSSSSDASSQSSSSSSEIPEVNPFLETPALTSSDDYMEFFDPETKLEFDISIDKDDLWNLQEWGVENKGNSEIYLPSTVTITKTKNALVTTVSFNNSVGIRMKGNLSRNRFASEDGDIYNLIHLKLNFAKFGDTKTKNTLYDMEKLDLKWNRNIDGTQIRQLYSYKMYENYMVLSPKSTLAKINLNVTGTSAGTKSYNLGVYTVNENIDAIFMKRHFTKENAKGDLYKVTYTSAGRADFTKDGAVTGTYPEVSKIEGGKIGIEDKSVSYSPSYDLKENDKNSVFAPITDLIGWLGSLKSYKSQEAKTGLSERVYMDNFLKLEAARYLVGDPDDLRNNYNNTYVYFHPGIGKALFIPYDLDRGLGQNGNWNPTGNSLTDVDPFGGKAKASNEDQRNPLYKITVMDGGVSEFQNKYKSNIQDLLSGPWFTDGHFEDMYNDYKALYENDVVPSGNLPYYAPWNLDYVDKTLGMGQHNISFSSYIAAKKHTVYQYL